MVWEEMSFEEFQDGRHGGHLGYWNGTVLAILNIYVTSMPPIKFRLNPIYGLGGDVVWRISRWSPWQPSWIIERSNFSNSESLCRSDASHQVLAQSDLWFGRRCRLKNFMMATLASSWISEWNDFSNSESPCCHNASHYVSAQSNLWFWRRCQKCKKLTTNRWGKTDDRPRHKPTWSKAQGELRIHW